MPDLSSQMTASKDAEVLGALLQLVPEKDKALPLIDNVLKKHGNMCGVLATSVSDLTEKDKMPPKAALLLKFCDVVVRRLACEELKGQNICENKAALRHYCMVHFSQEKNETFHLLLLDKKMGFIADKTLQIGAVNQVAVVPTLVAQEALNYHAPYVILAHNHPSGHIMPSAADIQTSRYFKSVLMNLSIGVYDSLIVGKEGVYSLRQQGPL